MVNPMLGKKITHISHGRKLQQAMQQLQGMEVMPSRECRDRLNHTSLGAAFTSLENNNTMSLEKVTLTDNLHIHLIGRGRFQSLAHI